MPRTTSNRRSRSDVEDESEADAVRYSSSTKSSPEPSEGPKRRRSAGRSKSLAEDDNKDKTFYSVNEDLEDTESAEHDSDDQEGQQPQTNGTTPVDFQPGAIVRVRVEDFVTYERAEFFPGPNLNMVIGPNGTGKSSLVCAICLGLGYPTNVLGRAGHAGEFVKHGKNYAEVEIELVKRPEDPSNWIVHLRITKEDNSRKYWVNNKEYNQKKLASLIRSLRIQIDNLCQFLPQDKVAEFAGLNSVELLGKTLQAAASPDMIESQDQLKQIYGELKDIEEHAKTDVETLKVLENRQQLLQADVDRLREREEIQKLVEDLQNSRIVKEYDEASKSFHASKDAKKEAEAELKRLEESSEPSLQAVRNKELYHEQILTASNQRTRILKDAENAGSRIDGEIEELDTKIKAVEDKKDSSENNRKKQNKDMGDLRHKIDQLEKSYAKGSNGFTASEWNTRIREQEHQYRENQTAQGEIEDQLNEVKNSGREVHEQERRIRQKIDNLNSKKGQAFNQLQRFAPEVASGLKWLQENGKEFEKEVFGPAMLTCSVKDDRYSDPVQCMLQQDDFLCFTTQTRNDHLKLSDQFFKHMRLSVSIRMSSHPIDFYQHPLPQNQLGAFGLDGYAADYLEGPEPVLAMLCHERKLHTSAVALSDVSGDQFENLVAGEKITSWAAGSQHYRVTRRREYGPSAVNTTTRSILPGRFWKDQPVDGAEVDALKRQLIEARGMVDEKKGQYEEVKTKRDELRGEASDLKKEIDRLRSEKNKLQKEFNMWQGIPDKIEHQKKLLGQRQEALEAASAEISDFDDQKDELVVERAKVVLRFQETNEVIRAAYQAVDEAQVMRLEAASDIQGLVERNADITRMLTEQKQQIVELTAEMDRTRQVGRQAKAAVLALFENEPEERQQYYKELCNTKTLEDIDNEIAAETSKLEYVHAANPGALREFEKRQRDIEKLNRQRAAQDRTLNHVQARIGEIRNEWEPKVDQLISKINDAFSYNFEQISCAGEVGIHKDEDFEKWAIEIKVKFRENETLQRLDQHRQSGGERAVSTIFYLMSLQSMAQAPFRVVDEINQGMDPRNERMVHERMVEIACHEHTSQYFLITPKLLPGLRYDQRMKVLCIASGEHMPKAEPEGKRLDFRRCVQIQRRLLAAAGA